MRGNILKSQAYHRKYFTDFFFHINLIIPCMIPTSLWNLSRFAKVEWKKWQKKSTINKICKMAFYFKNHSDLLWNRVKLLQIWGWRLRICKMFEITKKIQFILTVKGENNFWNKIQAVLHLQGSLTTRFSK